MILSLIFVLFIFHLKMPKNIQTAFNLLDKNVSLFELDLLCYVTDVLYQPGLPRKEMENFVKKMASMPGTLYKILYVK